MASDALAHHIGVVVGLLERKIAQLSYHLQVLRSMNVDADVMEQARAGISPVPKVPRAERPKGARVKAQATPARAPKAGAADLRAQLLALLAKGPQPLKALIAETGSALPTVRRRLYVLQVEGAVHSVGRAHAARWHLGAAGAQSAKPAKEVHRRGESSWGEVGTGTR